MINEMRYKKHRQDNIKNQVDRLIKRGKQGTFYLCGKQVKLDYGYIVAVHKNNATMSKKIKLLNLKGNYVGIGENNNKTYLDIVKRVKTLNEAIEIAKKNKQLAIGDLVDNREIGLANVLGTKKEEKGIKKLFPKLIF